MMDQLPLVTIGIPVYNEESYIANTIESAINQKYLNLEIVVSDNYSQDETWQIIEEFKQKDSRIVSFKQSKNIGVVENFRFVRDQAKGKYFMWLGGHDLININFIQEAISFLIDQKDYTLFYPRSEMFDLNNQKLNIIENSIELKNSSIVSRGIFLLKNINFGTAIHGVFRVDFIKELPLNNRGCDDMLILFLSSLKGNIKSSSEPMYSRMKYRSESNEQVDARYKSYGYITEIHGFSLRDLIGLNHALYLFKASGLKLRERIELLRFITLVYHKVDLKNFLRFSVLVEKRIDFILIGFYYFLVKRIIRHA